MKRSNKKAASGAFSGVRLVATRTTTAEPAAAIVTADTVSVGFRVDKERVMPDVIDQVEAAIMANREVRAIAWAFNPTWDACRGLVMVHATEKHVDDAIATAAIVAGQAITECNTCGVAAHAADSATISQWGARVWANKGEEFPPLTPVTATPLHAVVDGRVTASFQIDVEHEFSREAWWEVWLSLVDGADVTISRWARPREDGSGVRAGGILTVADNSAEEVALIADDLIRAVPPEVRLRVRRMRGRQIIGRIASGLVGVAPWVAQKKTLDCEV